MLLENAQLRVRVLPLQGGGIGAFEWIARGEPVALMRPCDPALAEAQPPFDPNLLACYPLVPWSNRIAGGGFDWRGRRVALAPNRGDDPYPIHGSGWQRAWQVRMHDGLETVLELNEAAEAYAYRATLHYALQDAVLAVRLRVTNMGPVELPFGLGLHPFFPSHGGAILRAPAAEVWINDGRSPLPTARIAVPPAWDFAAGKALPPGLNHGFQAWSGEASILWPYRRLGLRITANVDAFILYTPEGEDFFCFEPVDHAINAVHLPGGAAANGMTVLAPRASFERSFSFAVIPQFASNDSSPCLQGAAGRGRAGCR